MRSQTFRLGTFALFAGALALQSHWVSAQSGTTNYPNKTVKMIVPLTPGSGVGCQQPQRK